ncbi:MAG: TRAP transporter substrate-binding protein DctP [Deltaproteobacteria bacterium]|nr:TRAP transporter substrate-binding protein DctP [Deltaproteobacteria bacterium]
MSLLKKSFTLVFILYFALSCLAFAGSQKTKYTIRFAHGLPPTHRIATNNFNYFKNLVEQESGGQIAVKLFPSGQLVDDKHVLGAVKNGSIEACAIYSFYIVRTCPSFAIFTTPMVFHNTQETIDAIEGPIGKELFTKLEKKGYMPLGWVVWAQDIMGIECKSPVHVPLDFEGKVIRPLSSQQALYLKEYCHAQSAFVTGAELYTALQRGTIDGTDASLEHAVDRKLSEVAPYFCVLPGMPVVNEVIFVNKRFFNRLPRNLQNVLKKAALQTQQHSYEVADKIAKEITQKAKACMKEVYYPTSNDLKLWYASIDDFFKRALKNNPDALRLVMMERKQQK